MKTYNVVFRRPITRRLDMELYVPMEAASADEAIVRAAHRVPEDGNWEYARVEVVGDDGGVDEVVV